MGVSSKGGTPKWMVSNEMVSNGKSYINGRFGGNTIFF
jgi:hypothetical protein